MANFFGFLPFCVCFFVGVTFPPAVILDLVDPFLLFLLVAIRWLPGSEAFGGTTEVSPYRFRLATTYLGAEPAGSVTGYDPPKCIAFHDPMLLKQGPLTANIDVHIRYTFEPVEDATSAISISRSKP